MWTVDRWKFTAPLNFLTASSETGNVLGIPNVACDLRTSLRDSSFLFLQMNFETENPYFSKDRQLIMVQSEDFISDLTDIEVDALLTPKRAQVHW